MDAIDLRIVDILQADGRITMKELGQRVGLTSPATIERVKKLEEIGIIIGYKAVIDMKRAGLPVRAVILVKAHPEKCKPFQSFVSLHSNVLTCHRITGDSDFFVEVAASGMSALEQLIDEFLFFGETKTHVVLSSSTENRPMALPGSERNG